MTSMQLLVLGLVSAPALGALAAAVAAWIADRRRRP